MATRQIPLQNYNSKQQRIRFPLTSSVFLLLNEASAATYMLGHQTVKSNLKSCCTFLQIRSFESHMRLIFFDESVGSCMKQQRSLNACICMNNCSLFLGFDFKLQKVCSVYLDQRFRKLERMKVWVNHSWIDLGVYILGGNDWR